MATEHHSQHRPRLFTIVIMFAVLATVSPIATGNPKPANAQVETCVVGDDTFDAGIDLAAWQVTEDGGATVEASDGRIIMTIPAEATGNFIAAQLVSTCEITGDFDVQATYSLLEWPSDTGPVGVFASLGGNPLDENQSRVTRYGNAIDGEGVAAEGQWRPNTFSALNTTRRNGIMRLQRRGNLVQAYSCTTTGGCRNVGAANYNVESSPIRLLAFTNDFWFGDRTVQVAFDNFVVYEEPFPTSKPTINSDIYFASISPSQATLYFETDQIANGYVDYGLTSNLGRVRPLAPGALTTKHSVTLTNLSADTRYYYRARATNIWGEVTSLVYWFRTPPASATARLSVTTTNSDGSIVVPGACFDVFRDAGAGAFGAYVDGYCDRFDATPNNGKVLFPALEPGSYILLETRSPDGYALAAKRLFSVEAGQTLRVTVKNVRGGAQVTIEKVNDQSNNLRGACFGIHRMVNGVVTEPIAYGCDSYDGDDAYIRLGNLRAGTYWVWESYAPPGYLPADGQELTIVAGQRSAEMRFIDYSESYRNNVEIRTPDANGKLIPGGCVVLFGSNGSVSACDSWDGHEDGRIFFTNVAAGTYMAIEYHAPKGYIVGKQATFTKVDNTFKRLRFTQVPGGVRLSAKTLKGSSSSVLPGACYAAYRKVSTGSWPLTASWCDSSDGLDGVTRLDGLKAGTYAVVQYVTPPGYAKPKDQVVTIGTTNKTVTFRTYSGATSASIQDGPAPFIDPPVIKPTPTPSPSATPTETATATPEPAETPTAAPTEPPVGTPEPEPTETGVPNASPVANAGPDQATVDADSSTDEAITLDGTASTDPDGSELTYSWSIAGVEIATGPTATVTLPVGIHTVLLTVTDAQGAVATDEVIITIAVPPPTEAPTLEPAGLDPTPTVEAA